MHYFEKINGFFVFRIVVDADWKEEENANHEKHLEELNGKIERLEERYILEEITGEMYRKYKEKFTKDKAEIELILLKSGKGVSNLEKCVEIILSASENISNFWGSADYSSKQRVQYTVFPKGIRYNKDLDECRTDEIEPVFAYIAHQLQALEGKKKGIPELNLRYAGLVEPEGVEPSSKKGNC